MYQVEVLTHEEEDGAGLVWKRYRHEIKGVAWRVVDERGNEQAIYDSPTNACDARNNLNTPPLEPIPRMTGKVRAKHVIGYLLAPRDPRRGEATHARVPAGAAGTIVHDSGDGEIMVDFGGRDLVTCHQDDVEVVK